MNTNYMACSSTRCQLIIKSSFYIILWMPCQFCSYNVPLNSASGNSQMRSIATFLCHLFKLTCAVVYSVVNDVILPPSRYSWSEPTVHERTGLWQSQRYEWQIQQHSQPYRDMNPLAVYVHCFSHSLILAVSDACTVALIRHCTSTKCKASRPHSNY